MKHCPAILVAALLLLCALPCSAKIIYVKWDSPGPTFDGTSWATAFHKVQDGLNASVSNDEVWVARGTYPERITLVVGVGLLGGFAGVESARDQRDLAANETILDAQNKGCVVTSPGGATESTVINGFVITGGGGNAQANGVLCIGSSPTIVNNIIRKNGDINYYDLGRGVYCSSGSVAHISNNTFLASSYHSAGASIKCEDSSPIISGNTLVGGDIECRNSSAVISQNRVTRGSGISCNVGSPSITGNLIAFNSKSVGGGVYCKDVSATITDNRIVANSVPLDDRGYGYGGGIYCENCTVTISSNLIAGNTSNIGGGVYSKSSVIRLEDNLVLANTAEDYWWADEYHGMFIGGYGGGVYCLDGTTIANRNVIRDNVIGDNSSGAMGISCSNGILTNNVVTGNLTQFSTAYGILLSSGAAANNTVAWNSGTGLSAGNAVAVSNNIVAFNQYGITRPSSSSSPVISRNCVYGNSGGNYQSVNPGATDIQIDPKLADLGLHDAHIQPDSPCKDAGSDAAVGPDWLDIDKQPRTLGAHADIGADESDGSTWSDPSPAVVRVSPDGDDSNDGSDWGHAKRTIQEAILSLVDKGGDVWVKEGIYREQIAILPRIRIYGGFDGSETSRDDRDWRSHETVLDGEDSYRVVQIVAGGATTGIDGFTITRGNASTNGGGIYCYYSAAVICNNSIIGNVAGDEGGGIDCEGSPAKIVGNKIIGNTAYYFGGGIDSGGFSPLIANNLIAGNTASSGGGIRQWGSGTVINNTIVGNSSHQRLRQWWEDPDEINYGGGIFAAGSSVMIANNIVAFCSSGICRHSGTPVLKNNCVFGNGTENYKNVSPGATDISVDPTLTNALYPNPHIQPNSPCVDAGDDSLAQVGWLDIDGEARVRGDHVDIGADESSGATWNASPAVLRVRPDGDDAQDGSSWERAKRTIQAAIDVSRSQGAEIWVGRGTYNEAITLSPYAYLYGGFVGTEAVRDGRDWQSNATVLDAQQAAYAIEIRGGYRSVTIDGFTVRNAIRGIGCRFGASSLVINNNVTCCGTGVYAYYSSPEVRHNSIIGNISTGAYFERSSLLLYGNTILGNAGRGIDSAYNIGFFPVIANNTISRNGTGVYCYSSDTAIVSNTISGNTSGGIWCEYSKPQIASNMIIGNTSDKGSGVYCSNFAPVITNNTFIGNMSPSIDAGAIYCNTSSTPAISNNIIAYNSGGVFATGATPVFSNNCFYQNTNHNWRGITGTGGRVTDPMLADREHGDYHLSRQSPCIGYGANDAMGIPSTDIDAEPRVMDGRVDIGADEYAFGTALPNTKPARDNASVWLNNAIVTGAFEGFFYIEAADRSTGIRVDKADHGVHAGDKVNITGILKTNADGERYIEASSVTVTGSGTILPIGLANRSIGGANWFYNPTSAAGQVGQKEYRLVKIGDSWVRMLVDAIGMNNIGLLVKTWGKVTYVGADFFYLDDGSHLDDNSGHIGVRVRPEGLPMPALDSYASVTGISSCYKPGSDIFRLIRATRISSQ